MLPIKRKVVETMIELWREGWGGDKFENRDDEHEHTRTTHFSATTPKRQVKFYVSPKHRLGRGLRIEKREE